MDTIGDFLTIIRNASAVKNATAQAQWSKVREGIAKILKEKGYIRNFHVETNDKGFKVLVIELKYLHKEPAIASIVRHSKPGCRKYYQYTDIPRVLSGLGISILTTSKGILDDKAARAQKVGGELLCEVC
jgi:small subunit ribosomal protein S8